MPRAPHAGGRGRVRRADRAGLSRTRAELAAALRAALLDPADTAGIEVHGSTDAAVLAPLFLDAEGALHAVFTRRRDDLRRHPGEISFPGGRRDPGDRDLIATALRETREELGLPGSAVEVVGALPPTPTFVTDYAIHPFVGIVEPGFAWVIAEVEVAEVLELRLRDLREGHGMRRLVRKGIAFATDTYTVEGQTVWGATGRILADLLERVGPWLDAEGRAPGA